VSSATVAEAEGTGDAAEVTSRRRRAWWGRADRMTRAVAVVVALQIVAVLVFGVIAVQKDPLWAPIDEGAHFDNVIYVASHGSYPVLGKVYASEQELAISQGRYPRQTTINPRTYGLAGLSYEAFQPPLYYYVAAPVTMLSANFHTKAILLRYFGLLLLLVSIALLARLSRHVLKRQWLFGLAGGLLLFLMPGLLLRMVTISNLALGLPLAILILTEFWIAWERGAWRRLPLCGFLVGAGVLSDLYLAELALVYVIVALVLCWRHRSGLTVLAAAMGSVLGVLVVLPWVVFNEIKYHAVTAAAIARVEQQPLINPHHLTYTVGQLPSQTVNLLFQPLLPEEWGGRLLGHPVWGYAASIFEIAVVPIAVLVALSLGRRLLRDGSWMLVVPWFCNLGLVWYIQVGEQTSSMQARYLFPTLLPLLLCAVAAVVVQFRARLPLLLTLAGGTAFLVGLWAFLVPNISMT
jgi:4-amino-4-deoxy-L-arabinose transferase-like glycosyltransferase